MPEKRSLDSFKSQINIMLKKVLYTLPRVKYLHVDLALKKASLKKHNYFPTGIAFELMVCYNEIIVKNMFTKPYIFGK